MSSENGEETGRVKFYVSSISCVACTPAYRKGLRSPGIRKVRELAMLNRVEVEFDPSMTDEAAVEEEVRRVAARAGFKGKVIFSR